MERALVRTNEVICIAVPERANWFLAFEAQWRHRRQRSSSGAPRRQCRETRAAVHSPTAEALTASHIQYYQLHPLRSWCYGRLLVSILTISTTYMYYCTLYIYIYYCTRQGLAATPRNHGYTYCQSTGSICKTLPYGHMVWGAHCFSSNVHSPFSQLDSI
jgi:hypothetical protein